MTPVKCWAVLAFDRGRDRVVWLSDCRKDARAAARAWRGRLIPMVARPVPGPRNLAARR